MASSYHRPTARSDTPEGDNMRNTYNEENNNGNPPVAEGEVNNTASNNTAPAPDPAPAPTPGAKAIELLFRDQAGSELHFKLKPTTVLKKAMDAFSARTSRERRTLRFLFEGERVLDHHTPESLELQNEDVIEVHMEQIGGGDGKCSN